MTDESTHSPSSEPDPDLDHDARRGGPAVNAPADEPDPGSETQREQGDAGRRRGTDDA